MDLIEREGEREEETEAVNQIERENTHCRHTRHHVHLNKAGENHLCYTPQQRPAGHRCRGESFNLFLTLIKKMLKVVFIRTLFLQIVI